MIQLHADCLMFQMTDGESVPCSAELVAVELIGPAASAVDSELVRNAARAVLHYFKTELGKTSVSVGEFSQALAQVLRGFGLIVKPAQPAEPPGPIAESDLGQLACESGKGFELAFFPRLREQLRQDLVGSPRIVRFKGLRGCVKQLAGARRWTARCQQLNDQIVDYLRHCLSSDPRVRNCSLVVV
jgi:hypothetical protein